MSLKEDVLTKLIAEIGKREDSLVIDPGRIRLVSPPRKNNNYSIHEFITLDGQCIGELICHGTKVYYQATTESHHDTEPNRQA